MGGRFPPSPAGLTPSAGAGPEPRCVPGSRRGGARYPGGGCEMSRLPEGGTPNRGGRGVLGEASTGLSVRPGPGGRDSPARPLGGSAPEEAGGSTRPRARPLSGVPTAPRLERPLGGGTPPEPSSGSPHPSHSLSGGFHRLAHSPSAGFPHLTPSPRGFPPPHTAPHRPAGPALTPTRARGTNRRPHRLRRRRRTDVAGGAGPGTHARAPSAQPITARRPRLASTRTELRAGLAALANSPAPARGLGGGLSDHASSPIEAPPLLSRGVPGQDGGCAARSQLLIGLVPPADGGRPRVPGLG